METELIRHAFVSKLEALHQAGAILATCTMNDEDSIIIEIFHGKGYYLLVVTLYKAELK